DGTTYAYAYGDPQRAVCPCRRALVHLRPEKAVGIVVHLDHTTQTLGQIGAQMATIDGGQVRRHYAVIVPIEDTGKADAHGASCTEAGVSLEYPLADQLLQPLVIIAGSAHALLMTEIQAAVIHSERYLGATDIKAVIHAHTPLSASCLTSACPEGHIVLIRKKNKVTEGEKREPDQSKRNICRCRQAWPRLIRVRSWPSKAKPRRR